MKKLFLFSSLSFCLLFLTFCQKRVSPLELVVRDYVGDLFPSYLNDSIDNNDTLFLRASFVTLCDSRYYQYKIKDSLNRPKVVLSIGSTKEIDYPSFDRILPPPLPPPPMPDIIGQYEEESETYGAGTDVSTSALQNLEYCKVDSVKEYKWCVEVSSCLASYETMLLGAPTADLDTFQYYQEVFDHYTERLEALDHVIDSLCLLSPEVIGYTTFGRVHVTIIAEKEVDKKYVDTFLHGVKVLDLRPRYIYDKKNGNIEILDDIILCKHFVYGIEENGQFKQVGEFMIE